MKAPQQSTKPADIMPEGDADDGIDHNADAGRIDQGAGDDGQQPHQQAPIHTVDPYEDERTAAVRAYRAKRDAEAAANRGEKIPGRHLTAGQVLTGQDTVPDDAREEPGRIIYEGEDPDAGNAPDDGAPADDGNAPGSDAPGAAPAAAAQTSATADDMDREIPLVIDGKVVTKKLSEIVRHAQRDLAADNRLEEAKRILSDARAVRASPGTLEHQQGDDGDNDGNRRSSTTHSQPEHQPDDETVIDAATARELARKIQVGSEEEGSEAIVELIKAVSKRNTNAATSADQIRQATRQELQELEKKREIETALEKFSADFPHIVGDADLTEVAMNRVKAELRADLKAAGLDDDSLDRIKDDAKAMSETHRSLRQQGARLRDYGTLLGNVGTYLNNKFGKSPENQQQRTAAPPPRTVAQPQFDPRLQQRQDMKRSAPQQPRAAGVRGTAQPQQAKPKSKAEIVADMRRNRGFNH